MYQDVKLGLTVGGGWSHMVLGGLRWSWGVLGVLKNQIESDGREEPRYTIHPWQLLKALDPPRHQRWRADASMRWVPFGVVPCRRVEMVGWGNHDYRIFSGAPPHPHQPHDPRWGIFDVNLLAMVLP
jgi:hypothetical protein